VKARILRQEERISKSDFLLVMLRKVRKNGPDGFDEYYVDNSNERACPS